MARWNARIPAMIAALLFLGAMTMLPYPNAEAKSKMQKQAFGKIQDGQSVDLYTLTNKYGMSRRDQQLRRHAGLAESSGS